MEKHKRINWYTGFIPLVVILSLGIVHSFFGNPFSEIIAGQTIDSYINEKYPGCYYEDYSYDFTCNGYVAVLLSDENPDVKIILNTDIWGTKIVSDNSVGKQ